MKHNLQLIFDFFHQLKYNNNVDWMHANKKLYERARDEFYSIGDDIVNQLSLTDASICMQNGKDSSFRLARDTRFSNNKLPYHTHFGMLITPQGKLSAMAGYFIYLQPNDDDGDYFVTSMIGAGIYAPPAKLAKIIRQAIYDDGEPMQQFLQSDMLKNSGLRFYDEEKLRGLPKEWKDSQYQDLLRSKHWMLMQNIDEKEVVESDFVMRVVNSLAAAKQWNNFLNQALLDSGESLTWKR